MLPRPRISLRLGRDLHSMYYLYIEPVFNLNPFMITVLQLLDNLAFEGKRGWDVKCTGTYQTTIE